ncbi:MAG: wax ester/triacylglycerol synthase family O-acyltransferase [Halieaceae bacterium]|jgi:WS/DGAT/MGAT family acyltransferase|nr:wax ester/triacylglycerol synthase family O-acyltransferase [Halieaceae bacterium]
MQQLTGLDASFLYLETPNSPMHISGLYLYTQESAPGGKVRFKQILEFITSRVQRLPSMTKRLKRVPLDLDHPYWVDDGDFDPEYHIRHVRLPEPGDWRQLCIMVSRIHARPLDRARPLWEMYVIEGLDRVEGCPPGSFAIYTKMHHAAVDGASGMEVTAAIHDLEPTVAGDIGDWRSREGEPGALKLLGRAQLNALRQPLRFVSVARNTVPGFAKAFMMVNRGKLERVAKVPRTRFNGSVSPYRVFTGVSLRLDDIKAIKNAVEGTTVNDVAITIVGGALRRYLQDKKELPAQSLVAMAPINVRNTSEKGTGGNVVSTMAVKVYSEVEDGEARLRAVNRGTQSAKELSQAIGAKSMTDYAQFIPSTLTAQAARLASRWHLANQIKPFYNCVITNVPGPQVPLYCAGARMISNYGAGPCADSLGLFQVISSYCGEFTISVTCCREMMPDPGFYRECLQASFEELQTSVLGSRTGTAAERRPGKKASPGAPKKAAKKAPKRTTQKAATAAKAKPRKAAAAAGKVKRGPAARPKARPKRAATNA